MSLTVTAAQSGTGAENGIELTVKVVTGQAGSPAGTANNSGTLTTPQLAITPAATGSWVYGAVAVSPAGGSTTFTANGSTTFSFNAVTATWSFGTYRSTSTTTASTPVTLGGTAPTSTSGQIGLAQAEIEAGTGLAEDASSPATANTTAATSVTTASFDPPANSVLVAMVVSHATGNNGQSTTLSVSDSSGLTWTQQAVATVSAGGSGTFQVAGVWTAVIPPAGGVPQRYGQAAAPSPAPWAQRDRRDANTVATAANPLVSPLDSAWQADARYWHLYGDTAARDRRAYFAQRNYISDPSLLAPAGNADPLALNPEQSDSSDLWRVAAVPAFYDRREVPQQRAYYGPPVTALLENELLGSADDLARHRAWYADRREVPQQRPLVSDPSLASSDVTAGGGTTRQWTGPEDLSGWAAQRRYISDPSAYPPQNNLDPLLAGQDLLGGHQHQAATHYDRREVPQQRPYVSDPSFYPTVAPTDPLTIAWGAGGPYWHLYHRAEDITDRREVPQQRAYVSVPGLLATALLENELLGGGDDLARHRAWYPDRREVPQQRPGTSMPDIPADPLTLGDDRGRHLLAAGYWPRGWAWFQRQFFPVPVPPPPPPPFTTGTLTAADAALAILTAADSAGGGGTLTAADQRTGGPGG